MIRTVLNAAIASTAIALAGPALAGPGGGGHGGGGPGANVNVNVPAGVPNQNALDARVNSQGPANASPMGTSNASPNSVLNTNTTTTTTTTVRGRGVMASALPGLSTGLTVRNSAGTSIGTISRIVTDANGTIRAVLVVSPSGRTFRLPATTLTISGDVVTTTSL